jgi:hypothetical protein
MKPKNLTSLARALSLLVLVSATCALAQQRWPMHLTGLLNDYSPSTVSGGPWEMHGQWSMDVYPQWDTADFYADMTMSGYGTTSAGAPDATQGGAKPHTHHIALTKARITWDTIGCPTYAAPVPTVGFQINGTVSLVTGNGQHPTFDPATPPTSTLQICVSGGTLVTNANITLVWGGGATMHFGTQAIHGVVRKTEELPRPEEFGRR